MTWTQIKPLRGCFLLKRRVYLNSSGKAFLCLGFQTYAAVGIPLEKQEVDGKDRLLKTMVVSKNYGICWMMVSPLLNSFFRGGPQLGALQTSVQNIYRSAASGVPFGDPWEGIIGQHHMDDEQWCFFERNRKVGLSTCDPSYHDWVTKSPEAFCFSLGSDWAPTVSTSICSSCGGVAHYSKPD